ncbi:putative O-glycosylation ligase, exosortase A system-associated [Novosphingobium beihaiensis]|uniref:O-glycosylation ligase, exosortase A system-associated n=1 Tax=Novosphingobium beihaiensis TaxID=2930389 RepID=A0ABT0BUU0_9SPHN|nr:putative O-glycosylation ligase, exosortase A system-associated [Novosphingobium beihaiensis]MCJ2188566.1 putative O-glycosylation ligase, exosortase A system-associated [Novosphingobium beihaiensis]
MTGLVLLAFFACFLVAGFKRPFLWLLCYLYVDALTPQKIAWGLLASIPVSLIAFVAAFGGWLVMDRKDDVKVSVRQVLIVVFLVYCGLTTLMADFPTDAAEKWDWVWKSLFFAAFFPLTLRTRLRMEAAMLVVVLSVGSIAISAGMKTALGGGGYGVLQAFVNDNSGLYEGSTLSMVAIAIIPLIIWLSRYGTIFPSDWRVKLFAVLLIFACLMTTVGLQTRTGLLCIVLLTAMWLRRSCHRFLLAGVFVALAVMAIPFLPASYTQRMDTIETHQSDESASTRIAVWTWTLGYVQHKPFGGGFNSFLGNKVTLDLKDVENDGAMTVVETTKVQDKARAFHSAYFEVLGEQGWPGLAMWLSIHFTGLLQLEMLCRRLRKSEDARDRADHDFASALQMAHMVCMLGAVFIGVAYQSFAFVLVGLEIALIQQRKREDGTLMRRPPGRTGARPMKPLAAPAAGDAA